MSRSEGAIGVFDSGVGGLSVVRAILRAAPDARILYVADQAHVPYGGRPLDQVRGFAEAISRFLAGEGCRSVVMACNVSSATALETVTAALAPLPVFGMISGAARAAAESGARCIGVLATEGTVRSGAYGCRIREINQAVRVVEVACPRFVPLVEAGAVESADAEDAAEEYLAPLSACGAETIVLGCTHYPFLRPVLQRVAARLFTHPPLFLDPADIVARDVAAISPPRANPDRGPHELLTTGCVARFAEQARLFLPGEQSRVSRAAWHETPSGLEVRRADAEREAAADI